MEAQIKVDGTHHWKDDKIQTNNYETSAKAKTCHISCEGQNTVHLTARVSVMKRPERAGWVHSDYLEMMVQVDGNGMGVAQVGFKSERALEDNYWETVKVVQEQMEMNLNAPVALRDLLSSIAKKG